jgi:hypothetical protein
MKERKNENMERQKVSARVRKITKEIKGEKKKENNKNNDILSLCVLFTFIYLFYLKFIHDIFKGASSSSEFTSSIASLIVEELMTRDKCVKECSVVLI